MFLDKSYTRSSNRIHLLFFLELPKTPFKLAEEVFSILEPIQCWFITEFDSYFWGLKPVYKPNMIWNSDVSVTSLTVSIFGLYIRFNPKTEEACYKKEIKPIGKYIFLTYRFWIFFQRTGHLYSFLSRHSWFL